MSSDSAGTSAGSARLRNQWAGCLRIPRLRPASGSRSLRNQVSRAGTGRKSTYGFNDAVNSQFRHPLESDTSGNGQRACACREHSGYSVEFANAGIRNPTIPVMGSAPVGALWVLCGIRECRKSVPWDLWKRAPCRIHGIPLIFIDPRGPDLYRGCTVGSMEINGFPWILQGALYHHHQS